MRQKNPPNNSGFIEMHLRKRAQLFDSLDNSPFREKDLDPNAEEYIIESAKEFPVKTPLIFQIHLDQRAVSPAEPVVIREAVRIHFSRRAESSRRALRQLLRRGAISLVIGLAFLVTSLLLGQFIRKILGEQQITSLLRESLLIGGWVAMWKPLEIFLYDWWPLVGERRLFDRLSQIDVRVIYTKTPVNPQTDR